jgi:hypothetical protein
VALKTIARAKAAGYKALVVTIDTPVAGLRERDLKNGTKELLSKRPFDMLRYLPQILARPGWLAAYLGDGGLMQFPNIVLADGPMAYADVGAALEQSMVSWDDFPWIRDAWQGPIVVKGAHTADDARRAVDAGATAVVVSNHGARQLDGVAPTIRVLPEVVAAVGSQVEVLLDSGIRRGSDVVKAVCLGARAVLIGRAYAYGLGAAGEDGVARAIEILRGDIVRTMKLLGCASVSALDASFVDGRVWHNRPPKPGLQARHQWCRYFHARVPTTKSYRPSPSPCCSRSAPKCPVGSSPERQRQAAHRRHPHRAAAPALLRRVRLPRVQTREGHRHTDGLRLCAEPQGRCRGGGKARAGGGHRRQPD